MVFQPIFIKYFGQIQKQNTWHDHLTTLLKIFNCQQAKKWLL